MHIPFSFFNPLNLEEPQSWRAPNDTGAAAPLGDDLNARD